MGGGVPAGIDSVVRKYATNIRLGKPGRVRTEPGSIEESFDIFWSSCTVVRTK